MHRFYLSPQECSGERLTLSARESHHAATVLRLQAGDPVAVVDGAGGEYQGVIDRIGHGRVEVRVREERRHPRFPCELTLLQGVPKAKAMETIIQKGTELGAARIVPLLSERVIVSLDPDTAQKKREKWKAIAVDAMKQCHSPWLPEIDLPTPLARFLKREESFELALLAAIAPEAPHPRSRWRAFTEHARRRPESVGLWIGPEGDFTPSEHEAIEGTGARPVSLGSRVLRTETASLYCLSAAHYEITAPSG